MVRNPLAGNNVKISRIVPFVIRPVTVHHVRNHVPVSVVVEISRRAPVRQQIAFLRALDNRHVDSRGRIRHVNYGRQQLGSPIDHANRPRLVDFVRPAIMRRTGEYVKEPIPIDITDRRRISDNPIDSAANNNRSRIRQPFQQVYFARPSMATIEDVGIPRPQAVIIQTVRAKCAAHQIGDAISIDIAFRYLFAEIISRYFRADSPVSAVNHRGIRRHAIGQINLRRPNRSPENDADLTGIDPRVVRPISGAAGLKRIIHVRVTQPRCSQRARSQDDVFDPVAVDIGVHHRIPHLIARINAVNHRMRMRRISQVNVLTAHKRAKNHVRFTRLVVSRVIRKTVRSRRADQMILKAVAVHVTATGPATELVVGFPAYKGRNLILSPISRIGKINELVAKPCAAPKNVTGAAIHSPQRVRPHRTHQKVIDSVAVIIFYVGVGTEIVFGRASPDREQIRMHVIVFRKIEQSSNRVHTKKHMNFAARRLVVQPAISRHCGNEGLVVSVVVQIPGIDRNSRRSILGSRIEHGHLAVLRPVGQIPE